MTAPAPDAWRRADGVLHEVLDDRAVLIDRHGTELITLNETGTMVWEALDGKRDAAALTQLLKAHFAGAEPSQIARDVDEFLAALASLDLVTAGLDAAR